jgi:hypothetical protein
MDQVPTAIESVEHPATDLVGFHYLRHSAVRGMQAETEPVPLAGDRLKSGGIAQ